MLPLHHTRLCLLRERRGGCGFEVDGNLWVGWVGGLVEMGVGRPGRVVVDKGRWVELTRPPGPLSGT